MHRLWHQGLKVGPVKLIKRFAGISTATTVAVLLSAGGAQAQGDGGLLSLLGNTSLVQVCFPMGQVGQGNKVGGNQNISCSQNAAAPGGDDGNGAGGVTGAQIVRSPFVEVAPGGSAGPSADCPEGQIATGGGYNSAGSGFRAEDSFPISVVGSQEPIAWFVSGVNEGTETISVRAFAVCVDDAD